MTVVRSVTQLNIDSVAIKYFRKVAALRPNFNV